MRKSVVSISPDKQQEEKKLDAVDEQTGEKERDEEKGMNHLRLIFMLSFMSVTVNSFNEKAISRVKTIASENNCYIKFIKGFCILSSTKNLCIRVWP